MKLVTLDEIDRWNEQHANEEAAFIKPASDFAKDVAEYFYGEKKNSGISLPWSKANGCFDLRPAEVTLWFGYSGHGKSLLTGQVATWLMRQGQKVLIASLEMRPVATLGRMVRQASGGKNPAEEYIDRWHRWTDGKLWIYDQHGTINSTRAMNLVRYATRELKVQHVFLDSLMKIISSEDAYNEQKMLVDQLCVEARDTGAHIHLLHHARKGADESQIPSKHDAKGTGAITDLVDNVAIVWKRKERQEDQPDALVKIDKQRHGDWEKCIGLWFDDDSQQFLGATGMGPMVLCHV